MCLDVARDLGLHLVVRRVRTGEGGIDPAQPDLRARLDREALQVVHATSGVVGGLRLRRL